MGHTYLHKYIYYLLALIVAIPIGRNCNNSFQNSFGTPSFVNWSVPTLTSEDQNSPQSLSFLILEEISEEIEEDTEEKSNDPIESNSYAAHEAASQNYRNLNIGLAVFKNFQSKVLNITKPKYFVLFHSWKIHIL